MKFYLVTFNKWSYNEYDAFVVVSDTEENAIEFLKKEYPETGFGEIDWSGGYRIGELKPEYFNETKIILSSYNAG